jgi:hypothetical protein
MGSGKTYQTIKYLKNIDNFIWMTPNNAQNSKYRLKQDEIDCCYYKDVSSRDKATKLKTFDKIIVCINSLHYLERTYKVVVIGEIQTLLINWLIMAHSKITIMKVGLILLILLETLIK